jgi:Domain of unknown function (DUF5979)
MGNVQAGSRSPLSLAGLAAVAAGLVLVAGASTAGAQVRILPGLIRSSPSDVRAAFHEGNAVLCSAVGFPASDRLGAPRNNAASDGNVSGTPAPNSGSIQPGQGEEVNITVLNPDVVVDAVVVKGGNGYNVYSPDPAFLPPTLPPPQHYIAPLNGGGMVPALSHWFVCYHLTTPPPAGSLTVRKVLIPPPAPPATPLPTTFSAIVNCNDGNPAHQNVVVNFSVGGGRAATPTLTGIPPGTICTVVEQNTGDFPPGAVVTFDPAGVDSTGVVMPADPGVIVTITNDFSGLTPQSGNLLLVKAVLPAPPGLTLPDSYTARVLCDDGTDTNVTLPGAGGNGAPLVSVAAGSLCAVGEDLDPLPAGWVVSYSVDGGAPSPSPPVFLVRPGATITITITNDPSAVAVVTAVPTSTPEPTGAPTMPSTLPPTGSSTDAPLILGVALVATGLVAIGYTSRRRSRQADSS